MTAILILLACVLSGEFKSAPTTQMDVKPQTQHQRPFVYSADYLIQLSRQADLNNNQQQNNQPQGRRRL